MKEFRKLGSRKVVDEESYTYFAGTSYLGLSHNKEFQGKIEQGIKEFGLTFGSSRLSNMRLSIYRESEKWLREWTQSEDLLTVSSGTLAGQLTLKYFEENSFMVCAPDTHVSVKNISGYHATSVADWHQKTINLIQAEINKNILIISNTVDPLKPAITDYSWLASIPPSQNIFLLLDDSHGLGLIGEGGRGVLSSPIPSSFGHQIIVVGSLGKSLGTPAGMISGPSEIIKSIRKLALYGGASPTLPAFLYALINSGELIGIQQNRLAKLNNYFIKKLDPAWPIQYVKELPVFVMQGAGLADFLLKNKILISSFSYPTEKDPLVNRVILKSDHKKKDIDKLINLLEKFYQ